MYSLDPATTLNWASIRLADEDRVRKREDGISHRLFLALKGLLHRVQSLEGGSAGFSGPLTCSIHTCVPLDAAIFQKAEHSARANTVLHAPLFSEPFTPSLSQHKIIVRFGSNVAAMHRA